MRSRIVLDHLLEKQEGKSKVWTFLARKLYFLFPKITLSVKEISLYI